MKAMNDSMAHPGSLIASPELPGWKVTLSWVAAVLISVLFLVSGLWKITDAPSAAVRMAQAKVPELLSLPAAIGFGVAETFTGVLIMVPRFRRWGAYLASLLLLAFMIYFAVFYNDLRGQECSCFPWVKRFVGPMFFVGDGVMLVLAAIAGIWAKPAESKRTAVLILAAVSVFALVSYGAVAVSHAGTRAPETITVDGKPFSTQRGRVFLYFFNPECMHCIDAAKRMARMNWDGTQVIGVPTQQPQFAQEFLQSTGLRAGISPDIGILKKTFPFVDAPAGVALEGGRQKRKLTNFDGDEPGATLKQLGFIRSY
jgi:uncharacterized membrane protein YphA (DoxX/SURF4 family)